MSIARGYILIIGALFVAIGTAYVIAPVPLAALVGLELSSVLAQIEVRGFYGGQLVGLGAFTLLGAWLPRFVVPGLLLTALDLGGTAAGRIAGIFAAESLPPAILALLLIELGGAGVALLLFDRERRRHHMPGTSLESTSP